MHMELFYQPKCKSRVQTSEPVWRTQRANDPRTEQSWEWVTEPELSRADRREEDYQASLTEVILWVESLLTQAYQTFSWTWVSECPVAKSWEGVRDRKREREGERSWPWCWKPFDWILIRFVSSVASHYNNPAVSQLALRFWANWCPVLL